MWCCCPTSTVGKNILTFYTYKRASIPKWFGKNKKNIRGYEYVFVMNEQVLGCQNGTQVRSELRWLCALHK